MSEHPLITMRKEFDTVARIALESAETIKQLESALADERERADTLAQALDALRHSPFMNAITAAIRDDAMRHGKKNPIELADAALANWRTARGAK